MVPGASLGERLEPLGADAQKRAALSNQKEIARTFLRLRAKLVFLAERWISERTGVELETRAGYPSGGCKQTHLGYELRLPRERAARVLMGPMPCKGAAGD